MGGGKGGGSDGGGGYGRWLQDQRMNNAAGRGMAGAYPGPQSPYDSAWNGGRGGGYGQPGLQGAPTQNNGWNWGGGGYPGPWGGGGGGGGQPYGQLMQALQGMGGGGGQGMDAKGANGMSQYLPPQQGAPPGPQFGGMNAQEAYRAYMGGDQAAGAGIMGQDQGAGWRAAMNQQGMYSQGQNAQGQYLYGPGNASGQNFGPTGGPPSGGVSTGSSSNMGTSQAAQSAGLPGSTAPAAAPMFGGMSAQDAYKAYTANPGASAPLLQQMMGSDNGAAWRAAMNAGGQYSMGHAQNGQPGGQYAYGTIPQGNQRFSPTA